MANPVHRVGDANSGGGVVTTTPNRTVSANGRLIAVNGSAGTSHTPFRIPHLEGSWVTAGGSATVSIGGIPVNRTGDPDTCGHARAAGSPDVLVG